MVIASMFKYPNTRHKMASLEASRGIAASCVMLLHSANLMNVPHFSGHIGIHGVFDFGYVGVDYFFVLSGFIITYVHYKQLGNIRCIPFYLWKRFSRIYPIFWIMLSIAILEVALGRIVSGRHPNIDIGLSDIPATIFLINGLGEPKYLGVAWTLQFEIIFYIAFIILLVNKKVGIVLFTMWFFYLLLKILGATETQLPLGLDNAHCIQFLLGLFVGLAARRFDIRAAPINIYFSITLFVVCVIFDLYGPLGKHSPLGRLFLGIGAGAILWSLFIREIHSDLFTPKWLVTIGYVSYSVYLGHIIFIEFSYNILLKIGLYHVLPEIVVLMITITVTLSATVFIGLYVELPLVHKLRSFIKPRSKAGTSQQDWATRA